MHNQNLGKSLWKMEKYRFYILFQMAVDISLDDR